ncbi:MAG: hypothetical protein ACON5B_12865 [Myxococcota bacterium]
MIWSLVFSVAWGAAPADATIEALAAPALTLASPVDMLEAAAAASEFGEGLLFPINCAEAVDAWRTRRTDGEFTRRVVARCPGACGLLEDTTQWASVATGEATHTLQSCDVLATAGSSVARARIPLGERVVLTNLLHGLKERAVTQREALADATLAVWAGALARQTADPRAPERGTSVMAPDTLPEAHTSGFRFVVGASVKACVEEELGFPGADASGMGSWARAVVRVDGSGRVTHHAPWGSDGAIVRGCLTQALRTARVQAPLDGQGAIVIVGWHR